MISENSPRFARERERERERENLCGDVTETREEIRTLDWSLSCCARALYESEEMGGKFVLQRAVKEVLRRGLNFTPAPRRFQA